LVEYYFQSGWIGVKVNYTYRFSKAWINDWINKNYIGLYNKLILNSNDLPYFGESKFGEVGGLDSADDKLCSPSRNVCLHSSSNLR